MPDKNLTAKNLKNVLWETLNLLRENKIQPAEADAIAMQSREIIRVTRSQQSVIRQAGQEITNELIDYATK